MSRSKVIKKGVPLNDPGMVEMFNQMLGNEGNPEIVAQKQEKMQNLLKTITTVLFELCGGNFAKEFPEYKTWFEQIKQFAERTKELQESKMEYKALKEDIQLKRIVMMCKDLMPYKKYLAEKDNLNDKWIMDYPDTGFQVFEFTKFDIKQIWLNSKMRPVNKKYLLTVLSLLYIKSREVHNIVTSPDMDVSKFKDIILSSIEKVQGMPELSRCKDAFAKITDSISLLENNFGDYYKDMVASKNPNIIIESFIIDVSQNQKMNPGLMRQFRSIINFYKSKTQAKIKDPKVKKLFESLNEKMNMFDNATSRPPPAATLVPRSEDGTVETVETPTEPVVADDKKHDN